MLGTAGIPQSKGQTVIAWEKTRERNEPLDLRNYARAAYKYFHWNFDAYEKAMKGETEETQPITRQQAEKQKRRYVVSSGIKV